jgi:hypothetical protein
MNTVSDYYVMPLIIISGEVDGVYILFKTKKAVIVVLLKRARSRMIDQSRTRCVAEMYVLSDHIVFCIWEAPRWPLVLAELL